MMARYTIKASITVDVEMSIEADSRDEAAQIFNDQLCMTAGLTDLAPASFDVSEDSISNVSRLKITAE